MEALVVKLGARLPVCECMEPLQSIYERKEKL